MSAWLTGVPDAEASKSELKALVGPKALHLLLMKQWGANVPRFGVVTTEAYAEWARSGTLPEGLVETLLDEIRGWGAAHFAVRSSMTAEDGESSSYAGVMETFLYVPPEKVGEKIIECFKSSRSERAVDYQLRRSEESIDNRAAAVVQVMVPSFTSGVAFSRAPTGNSALLYLEAGYGLGEGVVSGEVEVDGFWVDRFGSEVRRRIVTKESRRAPAPESPAGTRLEPVPADLAAAPVLSDKEVSELAAAVFQLESRLGKPADVEWAIADGELFILQVRPITQPFEPLGYYVDTNLSESYPGLTSPFTADFVKVIYAGVFRDATRWLGLTRARRNALDSKFDNLIAEFSGHLYYDLGSYYFAILSLPGGRRNLEAWHQMIGGAPMESIGLEAPPELSGPEKVLMALASLKLVLFHGRIFKRYRRDASRKLDRWDRELSETRSARETARLLIGTLDRVDDWGLPAINDLLVMKGLNGLITELGRAGQAADRVAGLLRTQEGVDSMGPLTELERICADLRSVPGFLEKLDLLLSGAGELQPSVYDELKHQGFGAAVAELEGFLRRYGDRAFEELKLECMTFGQSPRSFLQLVRWMTRNRAGRPGAGKRDEGALDLSGLSLGSSLRIRFLAWFTERSTRAREMARLIRGRNYGWVRRTLLKIAQQLREEEASFAGLPTSSFFGLRLGDLRRFSLDELSLGELRHALEPGKNWDQLRWEYPERFCHPIGSVQPPYFTENGDPPELSASDSPDRLEGVGAAPGLARGKALVLTDPRQALEIQGLQEYILVTRSTDPAWIFIMSQCSGLVSEKGSLLSHTAIIGRELGIATVVGVPRAVSLLRTGELIEIDGTRGSVTRVNHP